MEYAPIALFVYKRPHHTRRTIEHLLKNDEFEKSHVHVFCDGAKKESDLVSVEETRQVVKSFNLTNVTLYEQDRNLGLAKSISKGVTQLCEQYNRVIVIEDDLLVSPNFLHYMNHALNLYEDVEQLFHVSGYMYPIQFPERESAMLLPFINSWGWATWHRAWEHFDITLSKYPSLKADRSLQRKFDLDGSYPFFDLLERQLAGKVDSWAIAWYLNVFMKDGLVLYPMESHVMNIGHDGSGTHGHSATVQNKILAKSRTQKFPTEIRIDQEKFTKVKRYMKRQYSMPVKAYRKIKAMLFS